MKALKVLKYVGFGILGIGFVLIMLFVVQALWNWLIPALFHGPVITYWQAAGLFLLSKILLSGFGPGHHRQNRNRDWKRNFREKYHREVNITDPISEKI